MSAARPPLRRAGRPRRRRGPGVVLALGLFLALAGTATAVALPATAASAQDGTEETAGQAASTARLGVISQDWEVAPTGTFTMFLDVADAPAGSELAVYIYAPIRDAAGLAASTAGEPLDRLDTFDLVPLAAAVESDQQSGFTISLYGEGDPRPPGAGPWAYRLDDPGTYPIEVRLRDGSGEVLSSLVTYLVRLPDDAQPATTPTRLALLARVHQDPELDAPTSLGPGPTTAPPTASTTSAPSPSTPDEPSDDGEGDGAADDDPTNAGDEAAPLDPTWIGELDDLLGALADHESVPASFAVTPDTATRLAADPAAATSLDALRDGVTGRRRQLLGAPFVSLDLAPMLKAGLADEVLRQADLGGRTLATTLGRDGTDTWLVPEALDETSVAALRNVGVAHTVVPAASLLDPRRTAPVPLPGADGVDALPLGVVTLPTEADDAVLAAHQLLGRLAALGSITPGGAGIAIELEPGTADLDVLAALLTALDADPTSVRPTTLDELFDALPATGAPAVLTSPPPVDLGLYPDRSRRTQELLASYQSMVPARTDVAAGLEQPLARTASADLPLADRIADLGRVETLLESRFSAITLPARDRVTLGARDAEFPLRITSTLDEPAQVVISLEASDRLSFPRDEITQTLDGESTQVEIPVRTNASGDTPLRITVRTPDGRVVLAETQYTIRSTAVSGVGLVLTIGAGGFLALWWGRHWYRTRHRGRGDGAGPPSPPEPDPGLDDDDIFVPSPSS